MNKIIATLATIITTAILIAISNEPTKPTNYIQEPTKVPGLTVKNYNFETGTYEYIDLRRYTSN